MIFKLTILSVSTKSCWSWPTPYHTTNAGKRTSTKRKPTTASRGTAAMRVAEEVGNASKALLVYCYQRAKFAQNSKVLRSRLARRLAGWAFSTAVRFVTLAWAKCRNIRVSIIACSGKAKLKSAQPWRLYIAKPVLSLITHALANQYYLGAQFGDCLGMTCLCGNGGTIKTSCLCTSWIWRTRRRALSSGALFTMVEQICLYIYILTIENK
jgi:hypothetical protein